MKRDRVLMKNFIAPSYLRAMLIIATIKEKYPIIKHKINRKLADTGTEVFSTIVEIAIAEQELSVADEYASKVIKHYLPTN